MIVEQAAALAPADEDEARAIVAEARLGDETLDIVGGGSRAGFGRPPEGRRRLSSARLDGIVFHEPAEMTLRARAGAPLSAIAAALDAHSQMLPTIARCWAAANRRSADWWRPTPPARAASAPARRATV